MLAAGAMPVCIEAVLEAVEPARGKVVAVTDTRAWHLAEQAEDMVRMRASPRGSSKGGVRGGWRWGASKVFKIYDTNSLSELRAGDVTKVPWLRVAAHRLTGIVVRL